MKVFVHGADNIGWAIDQNRINLISALKRQNNSISRNPISADIIHNVWWDNLLSPDFFTRIIRLHPRIIVTTSNFIDPYNPIFSLSKEFKLVSKIAKAWIAFSSKQKKILDDFGLLCFQMPNYIDHSLFHPPEILGKKEEIYSKYGITEDLIRGRIVIGSFQRDSLGSDLSKPKFQKNPDCLIKLLEKCNKQKYLLLLAGPRRHYIINQCKKRNVPYYYIGNETVTDDIKINSLSIQNMAELYWISDLILVTSRSEGGPQAIMEATLTKTPIFSTDVGIARDFLTDGQIIENFDYFSDLLNSFMSEPEIRNHWLNITEANYQNAVNNLSYQTLDKKLVHIYETVMAEFS